MVGANRVVRPPGPLGPGVRRPRSGDAVLDRGLELLAPIPSLDRLHPRIATVVRGARVILTLAAARHDPAYRRAQRVALSLARLAGAAILLVDRSQETLADTPHHQGPFTPEEARQLEKEHLAAFLDAAAFASVDVAVWAPSLPLLESYYEETVSCTDVDLAVLPDRLERPKLIELVTGRCIAEMAKSLVPSIPVVRVSRGGNLALL